MDNPQLEYRYIAEPKHIHGLHSIAEGHAAAYDAPVGIPFDYSIEFTVGRIVSDFRLPVKQHPVSAGSSETNIMLRFFKIGNRLAFCREGIRQNPQLNFTGPVQQGAGCIDDNRKRESL